METYFAPPERVSPEMIRSSARKVMQDDVATVLLQAFSGVVIIINEQRQILAANSNLLKMLQLADAFPLLGKRPGEAINCVHSTDCINGCGTGEFCRTCGAVRCILKVLETNEPQDGECLLSLGPNGEFSIEFSIRAFPLVVGGERMAVVLLSDISEEKLNRALEQTFFHDIMNTITGLSGYTELFEFSEPAHYPALAEKIRLLTTRLIDEVKFQRFLRTAPSGDYTLSREGVVMGDVARKLSICYGEYWESLGRTLEMRPIPEDLVLYTDPVLLYRILVNMIKNAAEATPRGGKVRIRCFPEDGEIVWEVWNAGFIPGEVSQRIFQRFFSTKGDRGRGLGTYSMKLFGERYLGGKVDFRTSEEEGTTFRLRLPADAPMLH